MVRRRLAPAQTRGASAGAAPCQPLSQALSADPGAGQLLAEAARVDGLSDLSTAGLADWVWECRKRSPGRDASASERARHALETRARQSHARAASGPAQWSLVGVLAGATTLAPAPAPAQTSDPPTAALC